MKNLKNKLSKATAGDIIYFVCFVVSVVLLIIAFLTPPPFQIHESVLKAVGLMGIFSTISKIPDFIKAVSDSHTNLEITKGDTSIRIDKDDEN